MYGYRVMMKVITKLHRSRLWLPSSLLLRIQHDIPKVNYFCRSRIFVGSLLILGLCPLPHKKNIVTSVQTCHWGLLLSMMSTTEHLLIYFFIFTWALFGVTIYWFFFTWALFGVKVPRTRVWHWCPNEKWIEGFIHIGFMSSWCGKCMPLVIE